jgi:O-methyltransferase/methyltransferase family protein
MSTQSPSTETPWHLLNMSHGLIIQQALYSAAALGIADLLKDSPRSSTELARDLELNESALYRILRLLASQSVFEETSPRTFANSKLSQFLRSGVPDSVRSILIFRGSELFFQPFAEILYSVRTGKSARTQVFGMDGWEYLKQHPDQAQIFDDAMTDMSALIGPTVAAAYDFGRWESIMDVGGGNGILLASILKAHPKVRGVLADLPHVLERAQQRGYLGGELQARSSMLACDFFHAVPVGCRTYMMKSVIHDWDDDRAGEILANCRRVVPADGALLLVEWALTEGNLDSQGKLYDVVMLVNTGGKERTVEEYRQLLARAGFRVNDVIRTSSDINIIEALPE